MSASRKPQRAPPIATDLESLLEVEDAIERTLADARTRASDLVDDARAAAEREARELDAEIERARAGICTASDGDTRDAVARVEGEAAREVERYCAVSGARADAIAARLCARLVELVVGGGPR